MKVLYLDHIQARFDGTVGHMGVISALFLSIVCAPDLVGRGASSQAVSGLNEGPASAPHLVDNLQLGPILYEV